MLGFGMKCTYCGGRNLYIKRTSPILVYGCKNCEKKVEMLREKGLSDKEIKKIIVH